MSDVLQPCWMNVRVQLNVPRRQTPSRCSASVWNSPLTSASAVCILQRTAGNDELFIVMEGLCSQEMRRVSSVEERKLV